MINTNNVGGEGYKDSNQLPEDGLINETLSFELFTSVLSNLDGMDVKQASLDSHRWSEAAIGPAKREEFALIKKYVEQIAERLKEAPKDLLLATVNGSKVLGSVNLMEVKASIDSLKVNMADILKGVSIEDLENLEDIPKPPLFQNIFDLAKLYRRADELLKMPDLDQQESRNMIESLINLGDLKKALDFAVATSPELKAVRYLFSKISLEQAENLFLMSPDNMKDEAYFGVAAGLADKKELHKAETYAKLIKDETKMIVLLQAIYIDMIKTKSFDRINEALTLVDKLPEADRDKFCMNMANTLKGIGSTDFARKFARRITNDIIRMDIIWYCHQIDYNKDRL